MRAGIAYFGTHDPAHYLGDIGRIAQSFDWLLYPMTQQAAHYEQPTFSGMVDAATHLRLEAWISPWGGRFGGEGTDSGMVTSEWLRRAMDCNPTGIYWDEPKIPDVELAACMEVAAAAGFRNGLVLEPNRLDDYPAALELADTVGIDPYDHPVTAQVAMRDGLIARGVAEPTVWVQAFRIRSGEEETVYDDAVALMAGRRLARIAFWGWRGAAGCGVIRSDRPDEVQRQVERAINAFAPARRSAA